MARRLVSMCDPCASARRHQPEALPSRRSGERSSPSGADRCQLYSTALGPHGEPLPGKPLAAGRGPPTASRGPRRSLGRGLRWQASEPPIARLTSPDTAHRRRFHRRRTQRVPRPLPGIARCSPMPRHKVSARTQRRAARRAVVSLALCRATIEATNHGSCSVRTERNRRSAMQPETLGDSVRR